MKALTGIREEAQGIVERGNGFGVRCSDLVSIKDEARRKLVWAEIVKIGQEQDAEREGF